MTPDFKAIPKQVNVAYDLYQPALTSDLSIAVAGIQLMLDEDIRAGLVDNSLRSIK